MKNLIVLFFLMSASILSQSWNNEVATNLPYTGAPYSKLDMFANKDGIHMVVRYDEYPANLFKYYLINSSGTVVINTTFTTENNADFPKISGDNEKVYLAYKLGSELRVKKSTDAGATWLTNISALPIGSNSCNGIDIVYDSRGLHVVYAMKDSDPNYETYYYKLNSSNAWVDYKNVTDYNNDEVGGFPTVSVSANRVHVSYNTGTGSDPTANIGNAKSRDKNNETWEAPQVVIEYPAGESMVEKEHANTSKLFNFYYKFEGGMGQYHSDLYVKERTLTSSTWSTGTLLHTFESGRELVSTANTLDGSTHIVYPGSGSIISRSYSGGVWSSENTLSTSGYKTPAISTTSNDLFVVWGSANNTIAYRQYDAIPVAPQNFAGSTENTHPKVTWSAVSEPDVYTGGHIKVYRGYRDESGDWYMLAEIISGSSTSWVDNEVTLVNPRLPHTTYLYKVSTVDIGSKESNATAPVLYSGTGPLWKISSGENSEELTIKEFSLSQNYPNPFNPSTEISYQIPSKGFVTLKVYDVLGNEVSTLVNEWKEVGSYNAQFSTSGKQLASGMYFYTLTVGKFTDTKKFILMK